MDCEKIRPAGERTPSWADDGVLSKVQKSFVCVRALSWFEYVIHLALVYLRLFPSLNSP